MKWLRSICPHLWRRMTGKQDYGRFGNPHWGEYHGVEEEICRLCGTTREVRALDAEIKIQMEWIKWLLDVWLLIILGGAAAAVVGAPIWIALWWVWK